jgi:hypothetical protein
MRFQFLSGDVDWAQYGGKWVSKKLNNGDFDYWLVIELINMEEATGEKIPGGKYTVVIQAVSPQEAGEKNLLAASDCCGLEAVEGLNDLTKVSLLSDYGVYAVLWSKRGNNYKQLMKEAKKEANIMQSFFGFYMDKQENVIGNDGWDFIRGDIGFKRQEEEE